ncbi:MAG: AsmA-like C-terminal region-containing protein [Sulfitobacter sp.]
MRSQSPDQQPRPRRRHLRRAGLLLSVLFVVLVTTSVLGAFYLTGKPLTAPGWLQARIEARIARELPEVRVRFGEMVLIVDEGWAPRVRLRDVVVSTPTGVEIGSLNEFKATFAMRPLLNGVMQPRDISLSGFFATLERDVDGVFSLSGGIGTSGYQRQAASFPELIGQVDDILRSPSLSALDSIDLRAVTLQYTDARAQRAWTVDGGRARLNRDGDDLTISADLALLGGGADVSTLAANYTSRIGEAAADFGVSFDSVAAQDIAAQGPAFAWMQVLRAPISGAVRSGLDENGRFLPINATLQIGAGAVQPNAQTKPVPFDGARSYFSYDPSKELLRFDELSVSSKWVTGTASGTATLQGVGKGAAFSTLVGQFALLNLKANPQDIYPEPVALDEADVDFQLSLNPFTVKLGRLQIADQGKTLLVDGTVVADSDGWHVAVDGRMDGLDPDRLLALWPANLKTKTRNWLIANLLGGRVENVDLALRRGPDQPPRTYVAFDYADATVRFLKTMPPVTQGKGHFSLIDDRLVVSLDGGQVEAPEGGLVAVGGSSFILPDVRVRDGPPAVIRLATRSSVTSVLSLINLPPLRLMEKAGMPVTLAEGQAELVGTLALALKKGGKPSDVNYHVSGDLLDVRSDTLVKNRSLSADTLSLVVDNTNLSIGGAGRIDGVRFDGSWAQPIGAGSDKSALRGTVALDPKALDTFGVSLPNGMVSGAGQARIALDFQRGAAPRFDLGSNLQGIRLSVPQVSWTKAAASTGNLQISGQLGSVPEIDRLEVSGPGLTAKGSITLSPGNTLERLRLDRLQVGDWLDIPVDLLGRGAGKAIQVVLRGGALDLRRAQFGGAGGGGGNSGPAGPPMQVNLDRLQITDTIALTGLQGNFGTAKGLNGSFVAALNGATRVQGSVVPQNGRSAVRLTSSDAGGVLRSAGLLKQIVGGTLSLTLLPVGTGGAFDGRVTASAVRIKDAPGIAGLVNAVSVVGLINELNGDGIYFEEVEGEFRLTPNRLTLTQASAVGASMGLSMDGIYALDSATIDMQGVITPVYLLNGIGAILTRKGEGLIGFNYTLKGPASKPSVSVNPLSALTPGMFRDIFRAPPPELPEVEGVTGSTLPTATSEADKPVVPTYEGR